MPMAAPACDCETCRAMCRQRPCWPTPDDARRLIAAGHAERLMVDWWVDPAGRTVYLLSPAIRGWETAVAPIEPRGDCTFRTPNGLCALHDAGLKPTEGRLALCRNRTPDGLHDAIARSWAGEEGRGLLADWESSPPRGRRARLMAGTRSRRVT